MRPSAGRALTLAALGLLAAGFGLTLLDIPWGDERVSDLFVYRTDAAAFLDGRLPYRDVGFEYPPLAAPLLALGGAAGTGEDAYRLAFAGLAFALAAAMVALCGTLARRTGGDERLALFAAAALPLALGALIRTHFDLAPVVLTLAALVLVLDGRERAGFAVLGLGVVTMAFPLVVAPVMLAWLVRRGARREAIDGALALAATVAVVCAAAVAISPQGAWNAVEYQADRPVQIESVPASLAFALAAVGAGDEQPVSSHRSDGLDHPAANALALAAAAALLGILVLLTVRSSDETRSLVLAALTAITAFAALGRVLSPQFLIWVFALGALAFAWRMHALAAAVALAALLTLVEFPAHYADVADREPAALLLVGVRNAALLVALALALSSLRAPARESARSP